MKFHSYKTTSQFSFDESFVCLQQHSSLLAAVTSTPKRLIILSKAPVACFYERKCFLSAKLNLRKGTIQLKDRFVPRETADKILRINTSNTSKYCFNSSAISSSQLTHSNMFVNSAVLTSLD